MIARIGAGFWKEYIPSMLSIGGMRSPDTRLKDAVELVVAPNVTTFRMVGTGCEARVFLPSQSTGNHRVIISANPLSMISRAAGDFIELDTQDGKLVFASAGVQLSARLMPDMEFPSTKVAGERTLTLTEEDATAWAIVDEPTVDAKADDTIWFGITNGEGRLYVSAGASSWVAMVRDGQDTDAVPVSAVVMRKIRPQAGDIVGFCNLGLTLRRGHIEYVVGALSSNRRIDTYQLAASIIDKERHRIHLNVGQVARLREILKVVSMGADEKRLVPVLFRYEFGHLIVWSASQTITGISILTAEKVSGDEGWEIGIAGDSVLATLGNVKGELDIAVTDGVAGAMLMWQGVTVSIRASLRVDHQPIPKDLIQDLIHHRHPEAQEEVPEPGSEPEPSEEYDENPQRLGHLPEPG